MRRATLAVVALVAVLAGCGGGDAADTGPPGTEGAAALATEALDNLERQDHVQIRGSGEAGPEGTMAEVEVDVSPGGTRVAATTEGAEREVVVAGDLSYVRAPAAYWEEIDAEPEVARRVAGRWIEIGPEDGGEALRPENVSLESFVARARERLSGEIVAEEVASGGDGPATTRLSSREGEELAIVAGDPVLPAELFLGDDAALDSLTLTYEEREVAAPADAIPAEEALTSDPSAPAPR